MLANLTVSDIVLIDRLGIDFDAGLTVLTGETGAGKSILLDALALALGARGDASLVRAGAERGQVTAVFEPAADHPAHALLAANGIDGESAIILRRTQTADGKTRAFINDQPCSVAVLRDVGALLVEIHGQHDERALIDTAGHRALLDAFGRLEADVEDTAARYRDLARLRQESAALQANVAVAEKEAEYLRSSVEELETLSPEPGEETRLAERRQFLMRAEKVATDLNEALEIVAGDRSAVPELVGLARRLDRKAAEAPGLLEPTLVALNAALDRLDEVRGGLEEALRACEFDPHELERVEERLFALRAAARKYQVASDDLPGLAAELATRLAELDTSRGRVTTLERAVAEAKGRYRAAAWQLSERRREAAERLEGAVNAELPALKLETATFLVATITNAEAVAPDGIDAIAFHVRTNPGTQAGPLMKVASGGELSRFLLALKVALADRGSAPTLIFDEIDAGVGGAVAEAIGRRLARLAERVQVISVTHAPQVAARAAAHLLIAKQSVDKGKRVATGVRTIAGSARREEIARMLAGATISDEARAAADRLMASEPV